MSNAYGNPKIRVRGNRRSKGGINFEAALKSPGDTASSRLWKQAVVNVKAHEMPPDDEDKQPTDGDRQHFQDWVGKIKFLSPKDPDLFVIRRLTKVEYGNTFHDLFGVDPKVADDLPDEVFGAGYLNPRSSPSSFSRSPTRCLSAYWRPTATHPPRCKSTSSVRCQRQGRICAQRRKMSPARWPETPVAGLRRKRNLMSCCGYSIWCVTSNSSIRQPCT